MLESEAAPLIEKNYRWNFTVNVLDGATFWFGMSFVSAAVILPLFVSHYTTSPFLIGPIAFLTAAGPLIPQLLVAKAVAHAPRKLVLSAHSGFFCERLPLILLPAAVWFLADGDPGSSASPTSWGTAPAWSAPWPCRWFWRPSTSGRVSPCRSPSPL